MVATDELPDTRQAMCGVIYGVIYGAIYGVMCELLPRAFMGQFF